MTTTQPTEPPKQSWARAKLAHPRLQRWLILLAVLLAFPSLFFGFAIDDRLQRQLALGRSKLYELGPFDLFTFVPGPADHTRRLMEHGFGAWWSNAEARVVLLRPISSALMWLDYRLLGHPVAIHAHSLLWLAATVALACALYRRLIAVPWIAGFASLMFAIDPTHGLLAGWIAQRNALIAGTFGLAALLLHDRARRDGRSGLQIAASLCLGLGLFSAEAALGIVPYLLAHAWFLDGRRLRSLLPFVPPLLVWATVYKLGDYGAQGSGLYTDPIHHPALFLEQVVTHGPMLIAAALGLPGPDFYLLMQRPEKIAVVALSYLLVVGFVLTLRPILLREKTTRFFITGALLSVIPACATFPNTRLVFFASFGLVGALAQLFAAWRERDVSVRRAWARPVVYLTAAFHLYLAPLIFIASTTQMMMLDRVIGRTAAGVPNEPELATQRLIVVNAPDATFLGYLATIRRDRGEHAPDKVLAMSSGVRPLTLTRTSATSLTLQSSVALVQPGTDLLLRTATPFEVGYRVVFTDVAIEVTRVNAEGWPTEARFDFARPLEDASFHFMQWQQQTLTPFALPTIGERIDFPAQKIELF